MTRLAGLLLLLLSGALARAGSPTVAGTLPPGGTRATSVEVIFIGDRLQDPLEVITHEPGIAVKGLVAESPQRVRATFTIAPDCPLGEHAFRLRTASGLCDLRTFWVGALPLTAEVEPNNEFDKAQVVPLNTTITGLILPEDVDYFAVECKKGQRLSVEVEGMRLGRQFWDPAVAVLDSRRFEVAVSDDAPGLGQDCGLSVVIPSDGRYTVQLRESAYGGGNDCHYRLHVGHFPRPSAVVPNGGRPGETVEVRFLGDGSGEIKERVTLPKTTGDFRFHLQTPDGVHPAGSRFRVSDWVAVSDTPAAVSAGGAPIGPVPGAFQGVLAAPGQERFFRFAAKKGQTFDLTCHARRLGSPLDAMLAVYRSDKGQVGTAVIANDDDGGSPDSAMRVSIPDDGDYFIRVADHLGRGGPDFVFRVELTPPAARTVVSLPKVDGNNPANQERLSVAVPRGGRTAVLVLATRVDWGGAARVEWTPLPAGVATVAEPIAADAAQLPVVFTATEAAPLAGALATITAVPGDAKVAAPSRTELDVKFCVGQNNVPFHGYLSDRVSVAVTEPAPVSIEVVEPKLAVPQNGAFNLKVVAKRAAGFTGPITLQPVWTPPGLGIQGGVVIPAGASEASVSVNAAANAPVKSWRTALFGVADAGKGPVTVSTQLFQVRVGPPLVNLVQGRVAVDRGQAVTIACQVEFPTPLVGKATVKLLGLPAKATAADQPLTPDGKQIVFDVKTTPETPTGKHGVFCQVVVEQGGETVSQSSGGGELRVDLPQPPKPQAATQPAAPKSAAPPAAKPLSRLEKLRAEQESREKK